MKAILISIAMVAVGWNLFWFFSESLWLGGTALSGYRGDGQRFVGNHGSYRQVDCAVWQWNGVHGVSVFVTFPIVIVGAICYRLLSRMKDPAAAARAQALRASGNVLAADVSWGGAVPDAQTPQWKVEVFPDGILLTGYFKAPFVVQASDIRSLEARRGLLGGWRLYINYQSRAMLPSLTLHLSPESDVARAIEQITGEYFTPRPV